jgi:hypothetical protein
MTGKTKGREPRPYLACGLSNWSATVTLLNDPLNLLGILLNTLQVGLYARFDPLKVLSQTLVHRLHHLAWHEG